MRYYSQQLIITFLLLILSVLPANSRTRIHGIDGFVGVGYEDYDNSYSSGGSNSASSFYQQYRLSTGMSGNLYNERGGLYNFRIRYDYKDYQTKVNGKKYSLNSGDLDLNGNLQLHLYQLNGFYIKFYAEEDERSRYEYTSTGGGLMGGGFVSDVEKETYKRHGFFGSMGSNGGPHYYFSYNSQETENIYGYRERVNSGNFSVNSGSNWLTLSKTESDLGEWNEFVMSVGNVGTNFGKVGNNKGVSYKRYWYRISNWLRISTDYRYTKKNTSSADIETDRLTFAMTGTRERWTAYTYTTYGHYDDGTQRRYDLSLPFWLNAYPSPKSFFGLRSFYRENGSKNEVTAVEKKGKALNEQLTLWTRPENDFSLESKYSFAKSDTDQLDTISHSFSIRGYTQKKEQMNYRFFYSFNLSKNDDNLQGERSLYSHVVSGSLSYIFEPERVIEIAENIGIFFNEGGVPHEKSKSSTTNLNFRSKVGEKSNFSAAISKYVLKYDDGSSAHENELKMNFNSKLNSKASFKADVEYEYRDSDLSSNPSDEKYRSEMKLTYKESRELTSITKIFNNKNLTSSYASEVKGISESMVHTLFRGGYSRRPLLKSRLGLSYYDEENIIGKSRFGTYSIAFDYYPMRYISCGTGIRVRDDFEGSFYELNSNAYLAIKYPLVQITGSYVHREYDDVYGSGLEEDKYKIEAVKRF